MTQKVNNADGSKWLYTYDNRNRMTDALEKNALGATLIEEKSTYDPKDRRISKLVHSNGNTTTTDSAENYVYGTSTSLSAGADNIVLVIDPKATPDNGSTPWATVTQRFVWGPHLDQITSDETLAYDPNNQLIYDDRHFVSDHEGSVRKVVDDTNGLSLNF